MRMKIEKRVGNVNDSLVKESIALNFVLSITTLRHTILRSKSFITYQILFRQESQDKIRLALCRRDKSFPGKNAISSQ